ncbi:acyltransferase [Phenylobacterium sp.]|uniref:acyltransferase family protein n=1 Tax=Phenylobacterium sp. TaxID=1871053 RepID=UPI0025DC8477|nr:acyltransferase [Phenylobacterium sp.]
MLFASLVIVSHSPQILEGSLANEPLTRLFGTITLGAFAVDFFFVISGYLISGSYLSSRTLTSFLQKRVLRIYPAFVVAYLASVFLVGPFVGGRLDELGFGGYLKLFARMLTLDVPLLDGAFARLPEAKLNSPMWTISYEFRCYLLVPALGVLGLLRRRWLALGLTVALLAAHAAIVHFQLQPTWGPLSDLPSSKAIFREPAAMIRLVAMFMSGVSLRLFRDEIRFDGRIAAGCAAGAVLLLFVPALAELGLATLGAYAVFWVAFTKRLPFLRHVNNDWDVSYGVYLYAWPVACVIALYAPQISPLTLTCVTFVVVCGLAALSWRLVEEPCLKLKRRGVARAVARPDVGGETAVPEGRTPQ